MQAKIRKAVCCLMRSQDKCGDHQSSLSLCSLWFVRRMYMHSRMRAMAVESRCMTRCHFRYAVSCRSLFVCGGDTNVRYLQFNGKLYCSPGCLRMATKEEDDKVVRQTCFCTSHQRPSCAHKLVSNTPQTPAHLSLLQSLSSKDSLMRGFRHDARR